MGSVFAKLNLRDQREIVVLNAPASFEPELAALADVQIHRSLPADAAVEFCIAFAITQRELDTASAAFVAAAPGDPILWFAYPKGTSRRYRCEFNRDTGWSALGEAGFEGVRQVAIDADWSALRFRRIDFIRSFSRAPERASSAAGKSRARR